MFPFAAWSATINEGREMKRPTVGSEETIVPISLLNKQVSKVVISLDSDNVRSLRQITLNSCCRVQNAYGQVETGLNSPSSATVAPVVAAPDARVSDDQM